MTAAGAPRWRCRSGGRETGDAGNARRIRRGRAADAALPVLVMGPRACLAPLEYSDGTRPVKAMTLRRGGKAARVAEFGGDGERGEIVDAAEAAQALDAGPQRLERQQVAQFGVDGLEPGDGFVDGADVGAVGLLERGERPASAPAARRHGASSRPSSWR